MKTRIILCFILFVSFVAISAQMTVVQGDTVRFQSVLGAEVPFTEELKMQTFDFVWSNVNELYYDSNFNGVNWNLMKDRYLPLVQKTKTADELHEVLNSMLEELGTSHVGIISQEAITTLMFGGTKRGALGLVFSWADEKVLVTGFSPDYKAKNQISLGDELIAFGGKTVEDCYKTFDKSKYSAHKQAAARMGRISFKGNIGDTLTLTLRKPDDRIYQAKMEFVQSTSATKPFSCKITEDIAYIKLRVFNLLYHDTLKEAFPQLSKAKGWIIDLRSNPGGGENNEGSFTQYLFKDSVSTGSQYFRNAVQEDKVPGLGDKFYNGPVVILVNEFSGSSSEVLAKTLQELGRAKVVGRQSSGSVLASTMIPMPTGAQLQMAIGQVKTPLGSVIEGIGVIPDYEVILTQKELAKGKDPDIEKAKRVLRKMIY